MVKDGDNPASPNQQTGRRDLAGDQSAEQAKHTPGPWEFEGPLTEWKRKGNAFGWIAAKSPFFELRDPKFIPPLDEAELQANARLIAAAPDMYEALRRISKATSDGLDHTRDVAVLERCIRLAQSVVAKAEGRE